MTEETTTITTMASVPIGWAAAGIFHEKKGKGLKGIVAQDFVVWFLVSFNRSEVCKHAGRVRLLLKFRFRVEFFDLRVSA
jgi:hypothetical protein